MTDNNTGFHIVMDGWRSAEYLFDLMSDMLKYGCTPDSKLMSKFKDGLGTRIIMGFHTDDDTLIQDVKLSLDKRGAVLIESTFILPTPSDFKRYGREQK